MFFYVLQLFEVTYHASLNIRLFVGYHQVYTRSRLRYTSRVLIFEFVNVLISQHIGDSYVSNIKIEEKMSKIIQPFTHPLLIIPPLDYYIIFQILLCIYSQYAL